MVKSNKITIKANLYKFKNKNLTEGNHRLS